MQFNEGHFPFCEFKRGVVIALVVAFVVTGACTLVAAIDFEVLPYIMIASWCLTLFLYWRGYMHEYGVYSRDTQLVVHYKSPWSEAIGYVVTGAVQIKKFFV